MSLICQGLVLISSSQMWVFYTDPTPDSCSGVISKFYVIFSLTFFPHPSKNSVKAELCPDCLIASEKCNGNCTSLIPLCSSHDDISHFVSSAFFLLLISIADYSASVGSDLMREPTELLLPSFTVIALCSPPAHPAQAARRAAYNINRGGDRHFDTSAEGCD